LRDYLRLSEKLSEPKNVLRDNIGDAVLYGRNPLFRVVRDSVVQQGFKFTQEDPFNYFSSKLTCLDKIKERRLLPYLPNQNALLDVEKLAPRRFNLKDISKLGIPFNASSLHESCHVLASSIINRELKVSRTDMYKAFITNSNLEEGFTDTIEYLNHLHNRAEADKFSAAHNMYIGGPPEENLHFLRTLTGEFGVRNVVKATMTLSLCAHFLYQKIDASMCRRFNEVLSGNPLFDSKAPKIMRLREKLLLICRIPVSAYRIGVSGIYFKLHGNSQGVARALRFDPSIFLKKNISCYQVIMHHLSGVVEQGFK
jgi:hypothetical protein